LEALQFLLKLYLPIFGVGVEIVHFVGVVGEVEEFQQVLGGVDAGIGAITVNYDGDLPREFG